MSKRSRRSGNRKENCWGEERTRRHGSAREFDTDAALEKVMRLFWTKSYEETSVADLTETLGISRRQFVCRIRGQAVFVSHRFGALCRRT
jgi:AcrR family transcriptional regulator